MNPFDLILVLLAYLFGSISTAVVVSRLMGLPDPRAQGSGNPGATNVLRLGGKKAAALTLLGDTLKGVIPVLVARSFGAGPEVLALVAFAAFLGHLYPVFFGFKGGKGVATSLGVLIALAWPVALAAAVTWLLSAKLFRISSLAALIASVLAPFYMWLLAPEPAWIAMSGAVSTLLLWRHRGNIQRLLAGQESKIGQRG